MARVPYRDPEDLPEPPDTEAAKPAWSPGGAENDGSTEDAAPDDLDLGEDYPTG